MVDDADDDNDDDHHHDHDHDHDHDDYQMYLKLAIPFTMPSRGILVLTEV